MSSDTDPAPTAEPVQRPDESGRDDRVALEHDATVTEAGGSNRRDAGPSALERDALGVDRCATCKTAIGPRAYRISRVVRTGTETAETHYCSEPCLPDEPALERERSSDRPRDWSYCR
ncbi:hypothetical protein [Natrarchaeobius oligotrophus]|uniref:Uncharacterized protein n=1 Tax=Natrarchaeobius chitinivorans TaxID=1679083 RepID=A0A3N6M5Y8_NATCH|nr:hypothetical protein [Natrarchaeobius chitinivorans]RQG98993.1 hypothetical protein EA472_15740 [Natrarchaeobius chitinivorans]